VSGAIAKLTPRRTGQRASSRTIFRPARRAPPLKPKILFQTWPVGQALVPVGELFGAGKRLGFEPGRSCRKPFRTTGPGALIFVPGRAFIANIRSWLGVVNALCGADHIGFKPVRRPDLWLARPQEWRKGEVLLKRISRLFCCWRLCAALLLPSCLANGAMTNRLGSVRRPAFQRITFFSGR